MQGQMREGFYAQFLGGFALYYKEKEILVGMGLRSRPAQCLLLLLKAGDEGVERKELLSLVKAVGNDQKRQLNNLYQHMHVLREAIPDLGLPEGRYIVLRKGRYYFTTDYRVDTDLGDLDDLLLRLRAEDLTREERRALCLAYCRGYGGELLPQLAGEGWVTVEGAFYQRWYNRCLEELCGALKAEGRYEEVLELCRTASQLHPYDGWQAKTVESLLALGRHKEAEQVYRDASRLLDKEPEEGPLDRAMSACRQVSGPETFGAAGLVGLEQSLAAEDTGAPYYCSYPSFQDIYRIIVRMGERQEAEGLLLLCTLREQPAGADSPQPGGHGEGSPEGSAAVCAEGPPEGWTPGGRDAEDSGRAMVRRALEREMARLKRVLEDGLRACDVYTRYSRNQYLVLLIDAGEGDGRRILSRLAAGWQRAGGRDVRLELTAEGIGDHSMEEAGDSGRDLCSTCHWLGGLHLAGAGHMAG